jgi:ribosomal protein S18
MTNLSEEQKLNERIRLQTLNELLANPNLPIEKYNQYAVLKGQIIKLLNHPQKPFLKTKAFSLILISILAFSCLSIGALVNYVNYKDTPHPTNYIVNTGTIIQSPITGTSSSAQTNNASNPP